MFGAADKAHHHDRVGRPPEQVLLRWSRMVGRLAARLSWHLWGV